MNIALLLEMLADGDPERVVVSDWLTASGLLRRSRRAAATFQASGAGHIGYFGPNADVLPIALFGAALAGLPFVPLNYRSTDPQLTAALARVAPILIVADDQEVDRLRACGASEIVTYAELLTSVDGAPEPGDLPFVDPDQVAVLLFTSGTTGEPKAAVLRHRHLVSYVISSAEFLGSDPADAQLISVPPYHIAGISSILSTVYSGRRIVYVSAFEPDLWVRTANEQSVTHAMVVPTMLRRILSAMDGQGVTIPSLRHLSYGGGRMPGELVQRAMTEWPQVDFVNAYGLTETSSTIAMLGPDEHRSALSGADEAARARLTSVGRPLPTLEVEVRDEDGLAVPAGTSGEIWVRGEQVAGEYVGRPDGTSDGWFCTRDCGHFDEEGYLFVEGRLDDVIVRGGENISPGEIEDVLIAHPAVSDAAVVGIPDPEWGETVAAAVVLQADCDEAELKEWVQARLRSTRTPSRIAFVTELPYNQTGKLVRRELREQFVASTI